MQNHLEDLVSVNDFRPESFRMGRVERGGGCVCASKGRGCMRRIALAENISNFVNYNEPKDGYKHANAIVQIYERRTSS